MLNKGLITCKLEKTCLSTFFFFLINALRNVEKCLVFCLSCAVLDLIQSASENL